MAGLVKRGKTYYAVYRVGGTEKRKSLQTDSYQVGKTRMHKMEESLLRGRGDGLPTRTPVEEILQDYAVYLRTTKTAASVKSDFSYLSKCSRAGRGRST